ncbi:MAG: hypothetical protein CYPHOPRED_004511, partial [Cyphobasidiales sp. Tagirdzhanova-0007]
APYTAVCPTQSILMPDAIYEANTTLQQAMYEAPCANLEPTTYHSVLGAPFGESQVTLGSPCTYTHTHIEDEPHQDFLSPLIFSPSPIQTSRLSRRGSDASYFATQPRFAAHPYSLHSGHFMRSPDLEHSRAEKALAARRASTALREMNRRRSIPSPVILTGANTKLHPCDFEGCDRKFKRLEHKRRHERSHTQEKPYGCDVAGCGRYFSRSDNLTQHKRTHKRPGRTQKVTQANLTVAAQMPA